MQSHIHSYNKASPEPSVKPPEDRPLVGILVIFILSLNMALHEMVWTKRLERAI